MINKPPPLNRDYNKDPNTKALKRRGFINHGSTLGDSSQVEKFVRKRQSDRAAVGESSSSSDRCAHGSSCFGDAGNPMNLELQSCRPERSTTLWGKGDQRFSTVWRTLSSGEFLQESILLVQ